MEILVPEELRIDRNKEVLAFLKPLSCHSDILDPLENALSDYSDVKIFCPNSREYRYFFFYVNRTIFAFAVGMQNIYLRLPEHYHKPAIAYGASNCKEPGISWFSFSWGIEEMRYWSKIAYEYANKSSEAV